MISAFLAYNFLPEDDKHSSLSNAVLSEDTEETYSVYYDSEKGIKLVLINDLETIELINNSELKRTSEFSNEFNFIINAGYFTPERTHAGLLNLDGQILTDLSTADLQLTRVVEIEDNSINFLTRDGYLNSGSMISNIYFQTGPMILEDNVVVENEIINSLNGNGSYRRSILGTTSENEIFLLITEKSYSLIEIAKIILNLEPLSSKDINAVNLDGGSSVSLYVNEDFNSGEFKRLPFLIGIN